MENKKHILFISSWYPNRSNPTHGIFNLYFARAVSIYNKVSVIHVSSEEDLKTEFETVVLTHNNITTIHVYYKKVTSPIPLYSHLLKKARVLAAFDLAYDQLILKEGKPDLVQINVILPMGIGAQHLSQKHRLPYVINENWSGYCAEDGNYKGFFTKHYTKKIIAGASAILPTSHFLQKAMLQHHLNGNYYIVPNVVDVNLFKPSKDNTVLSNRFIHISSLNDKEKNVSGLIRAFAKAFEKDRSIELTIVGEGVDRPLYEELVERLHLKACVSFKGRLMSEHLVHEINRSKALIMFSNYETFCLVIIEAFACGKPVITSNAGAIADYMKPELGIMVNKNDEEQLTQSILKMANNEKSYNYEYIREFAIKNYSYENVGADLTRIYDTVLLEKKSN